MNRYEYNGEYYTVKQLCEMSGISPATFRDRIRRGYSVHQAMSTSPLNDGVVAFCEASWYEDWIGLTTSLLYDTYWKWCGKHNYTPTTQQHFSRQVMQLYPMLKTVPTKVGNESVRYIRLK